jgi:hypothetical protein
MPFVVLWSGAAPAACFSEVRVFDTLVVIFVQATRQRAQILASPISPCRSLRPGAPSTMPRDSVANFGRHVPMKRLGQPAPSLTHTESGRINNEREWLALVPIWENLFRELASPPAECSCDRQDRSVPTRRAGTSVAAPCDPIGLQTA